MYFFKTIIINTIYFQYRKYFYKIDFHPFWTINRKNYITIIEKKKQKNNNLIKYFIVKIVTVNYNCLV